VSPLGSDKTSLVRCVEDSLCIVAAGSSAVMEKQSVSLGSVQIHLKEISPRSKQPDR
jgi:hypothetical protein